ncbi:MAG: PAS domain S-box protein [Melioribacteraceae bacterium]|nr:PAS domain S-box protein [Melioribacteraceae bacterium]
MIIPETNYLIAFLILLIPTLFIFQYVVMGRKERQLSILKNELRKKNDNINANESLYRQMFQDNISIMLLLDKESMEIIDANNAAVKFYGYSHNLLINKKYYEICPDSTHLNFNVTKTNITGTNQLIISNHILADGTNKFVEVAFSFLEAKEREIVYAIIHDISERIIAQKELVESEKKYRALFDNIQDGIFIIQDAKFVLCNNALADMLGYKVEELIGEPFGRVIAPEDFDLVVGRYKHRLEGLDVPNSYEFRACHKDPSINVYLQLHVGVTEFNGKPTSIGTVKNITGKKDADKKLRELSEIIRQTQSTVILTDVQGKIVYVNNAFTELTGYTSEEVIGQSPNILKWDNTCRNIFTQLWDHILKGRSWRGELLNKKKDGTKFWVKVSISPIMDEKGTIINFVAIEDDITFEKYAREEIHKNEKLLSTVLNNAPIVLFIIDNNETVKFARGSLLAELNINPDNTVGRNIKEFLVGFDELYSDLKLALTGKTFSANYKIGNLVVENSYSPFLGSDGSVIGTFGLSTNVTARFETEQKLIDAKEDALKSSKLKTDFLAQMSHEIRTPVSTILNYTTLIEEALIDKIVDHDLKNAFASIESGGRRLIRTIDMILNMSQFQSGTFRPLFEYFDLNEILKQVTSELSRQAEIKNILLQYNSADKKYIIQADHISVTQIFINLIDNAIKYTHHGTVTVRLEESENHYCVTVKDTGIGMSKEYLQNIFTPFSQEETGYTRKFEGTGLGLALVKKYVEVNNATIKVDSVKDTGTTFSILFKKDVS